VDLKGVAKVTLGQGQFEGFPFWGRLVPLGSLTRSPPLAKHAKEIPDVKRKGKGHATAALLNLVARNLPRHVIVLSLSVVR